MADIKAIIDRLKKSTGGRWRWNVNLKGKHVELESSAGMRDIVLDCVRWGMSQAGFRFNVDGIMVRCDDERLAKMIPGREHHAIWERTIDHPDAILIEHAREDISDLLDALGEYGGCTADCAAFGSLGVKALVSNRGQYDPDKCDCGWQAIAESIEK